MRSRVRLLRGLPILFCCAAAWGQTEKSEVVSLIERVALQGDLEAAEGLLDRLEESKNTIEVWRADFRTYFRTGVFTASLGAFWDTAYVEFDESDRPRIAILSAICACEAASAALPRATTIPAAYESLVLSFRWLERVYSALAPSARVTVFDALDAGLSNGNLSSIAQHREGNPFYIQASLTLRAYATGDARARQRIATILGLRGGPLAIWQAHGILLFDNHVYSALHISSLDSVLRAIPSDLHAIQAIIVPEATGVGAGANLVSQGQILYLPFISMDVLTSRHEFIEGPGPIAPVFTVTVAQEVVRAVQAIQFYKRPQLAFRRDVILANAGRATTRYLRHYRVLSPNVYWSNPDELLPALAYLYFIDSRAAFRMALALFALKDEEPMDQFLLLADLLSGGSNTSYLYATSLGGIVTRGTAAIGRVHGAWIAPPNAAGAMFYTGVLPTDVWFCNAIAYGGSRYVFDFDAHGITVRYILR
ncbi:MAG TPA: hypothetical protein PLJ47_07840 [Candidatus Hydrogenedentes bacterium]|nr:hypothetical protein [Candidatus Hydrogenedentota bacterium]